MRVLLLVAALVAVAGLASAFAPEQRDARAKSYRGYKLLAATPRDAAQAEALSAMGQWRGVDVFSSRVAPGKRADLMVAPAIVATVQRVLADKGIPFEIKNHDIQESVNAEKRRQASAANDPSSSTLPTFERYMRYAEIRQFLEETAAKYPELVTLESAGLSGEGRNTSVVRISKTGGASERAIIIDAGIHAREWIAPPVALYLIQQLTQGQEAHAALLDGLDWFIMPVVNPDGYEYTHTTDRFWRKNRSKKSGSSCLGTDLNRNFDFHYKQSGTSDNPCSETYGGSAAFSEIEAANLRNWILKSNARKNVKLYISLHSYGSLILYPYAYDSGLPDVPDKDELVSIGEEANKAIVAAGCEPFEVIDGAGLYPAAGTSEDWTRGVAGIDKSYGIELPGGGDSGFDLPADQILGVVKALFEGFKVFAKRIKQL